MSRILLRRVKWALRGLVLAYLLIYAMLYKNTHLRRESVTGNVYVDLWPSKEAKNISKFDRLPYCQDLSTPCGFVNEVDLLSFQDNFVPTFVQVAQQRASCLDGTTSTDGCQLDYKTSPEYLWTLGSYYIGDIEMYKVQVTHAFRSEGMRQMTMVDAVAEDVLPCQHGGPDGKDVLVRPVGFCREAAGGGHDLASVEGLLAAGLLSLESNNDATNHPDRRERFRTSGMKLRLRVRYTNIAPWWSWIGAGQVGYRYEIEAIPARSVYRERTARTPEEARAWVHPEKLSRMQMYDRLLIWADGIDLKTEVMGEVGHLDISALLILLASTMPLLYFAGNIAELVVSLLPASKFGRYQGVATPEAQELAQVMSEPMPHDGETAPL